MDRQELLRSPLAYMPPARLLAGLAPVDAGRVVPGTAHSIVEILAHLVHWQAWFVDRCAGLARPAAAKAADGWPTAGPDDWVRLRAEFLDGLQRAADWTGDGPLTPPIEWPAMARYTVADALTHLAVHNAHHLGQIVTLRQVLGTWPPPEGSWTW